ncbi:MAG: protein kinase [Elusimicrobia bacterium]|nr:protein kinase [Elusimicrobiota bacterium]
MPLYLRNRGTGQFLPASPATDSAENPRIETKKPAPQLRVLNAMSHQMAQRLRPPRAGLAPAAGAAPVALPKAEAPAAVETPPPALNAPGPGDILAERSAEAVEQLKAGQQAIERGDPAEALASLQRSIESHPLPTAYYLRASIHNTLRDFSSAALDTEAGLKLAPGDPMLLSARSFALNHSGRFREAEAAAKEGLRAKLDDAGLYANLAYSQSRLGDRSGMLDSLERAAALDPSYRLTLRQAKELNAFPEGGGKENREPPIEFAMRRPPEARVEPEQDRKGGSPLPALILFAVGVGAGVGVATLRRGKRVSTSVVVARPEAPAAPAAPPPSTATLLKGRYELQNKIGAGGMGDVYRGLDRTLGRSVAVKRMRAEIKNDREARKAFLQEASIVSHLSHPYIVAIHEVIEDNDDVFLIFDYVDGKPLSQMLVERGRLPLAETKKLFAQVCEAISCAHKTHVLHRDLKPSNIMVDASGYAKVMDFGIAREAKETITRLTNADAWGTPAYMAPEQHLGRCAKTSDIFALGVCLYETLTGELPFPGPDFLAQKERRRYAPPQFLAPDLPKEAELLFAATLSPDPKARVAEAGELLASLQAIA